MPDNHEIIELITQFKESLEREMQGGEQRILAHVDARFDQIDARLDAQAARLERQAGLIQTGSRDIAKTHIWSDKMDSIIEGILRRLEALERAQPNDKPSG